MSVYKLKKSWYDCHSGLSVPKAFGIKQPPFSPFSKGESERFPTRFACGNDNNNIRYDVSDLNVRNRKILRIKGESNGFTLLEVLVATAILAIAVAVILQLFSANLRAISLSGDYVSAATKAESRMREILDDDKLSEKSFSETTDDGYRIDVSITDTLKDRTENLQVKLLQIDLTLRWVKGSKEKSLALSTMKMMKKEI